MNKFINESKKWGLVIESYVQMYYVQQMLQVFGQLLWTFRSLQSARVHQNFWSLQFDDGCSGIVVSSEVKALGVVLSSVPPSGTSGYCGSRPQIFSLLAKIIRKVVKYIENVKESN